MRGRALRRFFGLFTMLKDCTDRLRDRFRQASGYVFPPLPTHSRVNMDRRSLRGRPRCGSRSLAEEVVLPESVGRTLKLPAKR
jgi:hypothetical protein